MEQNTSKVFAEVSAPAITIATEPGSALFVINLCASMAPMAATAKTLPGLDKYRVYQVSRAEDGRTRYRLRLGFFVSEADAEQALATVRDQYPTAFTACLSDEDRKFTRGFVPGHSPTETAVPVPTARAQISVVVDNDSTRPLKALRQKATAPAVQPVSATAATAVPPVVVAKPTASAAATAKPATVESAVFEIDWEPSPAPASKARADNAAVAKTSSAASDDAVEIEMSWEPPAKAAVPAQPASPPAAKSETKIDKPAAVAKPVATTRVAAATATIASAPAAEKVATPTAVPVAKREPVAAAASKPAPMQSVTPAKSAAVTAVAAAAATVTASPATAKVAAPAAVPVAKREPVTAAASKPVPTQSPPPTKSAAVTAAAIAQPVKPEVAAPKPAVVAAAPLPASIASSTASVPAAALELATTSAPLSAPVVTAHRGVVDAKAPALDSIQLTLDAEAVSKPVASQPAATTQQPFHVGKGVELPATNLSLDSDEAPDGTAGQSAAPRESVPQPPVTAASAAFPLSYDHLDSTQTIRALTEAELNDESQEKCFAIQLVVSDQPVNLDAMPHLDIFEAYRLYSIATAGSGKITHSLRIGFFREAVSAEAVSGYLRTFFPAPTIVRISLAEQARFKDAPPKPAPDPQVSPTEGKVVALSDARARNGRPAIPTVTMAVATPAHVDTGTTGSFKPNATGSFKPNATGSFKAGATGTHKAVKSAAKSSATPTRRSAPNRKSATGKHPALANKPLSQQLIDEARAADLSESAIRKLPKGGSLLSRLVGKLSK